MKITSIHQIELTSRCNLRCKYCTHPKMQRDKIDMDWATFEMALGWASHFVEQGTQKELNLAGIGESTLHPDLRSMLREARNAVGPKCSLVMATNGIEIAKNPAMVEWFAENHVLVGVSLHRPEKAGLAIPLLKEAGILKWVSADPSINSVDWAGQVDWPVTSKAEVCAFLSLGHAFIMSDGRVTRCCFDAEGIGVLGHINDDIGKMETGRYDLCNTCHLTPPQDRVIDQPVTMRGFKYG